MAIFVLIIEKSIFYSFSFQLEEEQKLLSQHTEIEQRIADYHKMEKQVKQNDAMEVDDLDDFMQGLSKDKAMDKTDVRKCRVSIYISLIGNARNYLSIRKIVPNNHLSIQICAFSMNYSKSRAT